MFTRCASQHTLTLPEQCYYICCMYEQSTANDNNNNTIATTREKVDEQNYKNKNKQKTFSNNHSVRGTVHFFHFSFFFLCSVVFFSFTFLFLLLQPPSHHCTVHIHIYTIVTYLYYVSFFFYCFVCC